MWVGGEVGVESEGVEDVQLSDREGADSERWEVGGGGGRVNRTHHHRERPTGHGATAFTRKDNINR